MPGKYDVAILGAGTTGLSALRQVPAPSDLFLRADTGPYDTACARTGCVPSSTLIAMGSRPIAAPLAAGRSVRSAARHSGLD